MKKIWIVGALLACLAGGAVSAAPSDFQNNSQYAVVQGARKNDRGAYQNALYLDMDSVHVADVSDDGMIVTADILEVPDTGSVTKHSTTYKLLADGREEILGLDGKWYPLPENSDDPAAIAAMKVRDELGNGEKREQFVAEIQKILLKKQGVGMEAQTKSSGAQAAETAKRNPAPESGVVTVAARTEVMSPAKEVEAVYEKSSAVRPETAPSSEDTKAADGENEGGTKASGESSEPSAQTAAPKDTLPEKEPSQPVDPPVVVQIESHQPPEVKVEIKGHDEK